MVRYAPSSGSSFKGFALGGGSGDVKDKLMIGGLIVVIGLVIVALVMSIIRDPNDTEQVKEWAFKCMECEREWTYPSREEFAEALGGLEGLISPPDIMINMGGPFPPMPCPECGEAAGALMTPCPNCGKYYHYSDAIVGTRKQTREICPHCKTDVRAFRTKQGSGEN